LLRDDLYDENYADVTEALRRLPEREMNLRQYRLKRALDLSMKHAHLPRDQWTKPEEVG
jgi:ubiquinol-cytochrome c reductase subunit 7